MLQLCSLSERYETNTRCDEKDRIQICRFANLQPKKRPLGSLTSKSATLCERTPKRSPVPLGVTNRAFPSLALVPAALCSPTWPQHIHQRHGKGQRGYTVRPTVHLEFSIPGVSAGIFLSRQVKSLQDRKRERQGERPPEGCVTRFAMGS